MKESKHILYTTGSKYQLESQVWLYTGILGINAWLDDCQLFEDGWLNIFDNATWDGPSGPAIDTKNFMRGSLGHDKLYKLIRHGLLPLKYRENADKLMNKWNKEDGMLWPRRMWTLMAVRKFAAAAAKQGSIKTIYEAP